MLSKYDFKGTGSVFRFTLVELVKSRANQASLIFILLFALAMPIVSGVISRSTEKNVRELAGVNRSAIEIPGLTAEQNQLINESYEVELGTLSEYLANTQDSQDFNTRYYLQLGYAILVIMISILASTYIIRSVVEEKSSKLVEYMLISVRPLALLAGKILSILVYVVGILLLMYGCYSVSSRFCVGYLHLKPDTSSFSITAFLAGIGAKDVVVILVSSILGILTFAILSGLCGAGCSSADDTNGAATTPMLLIMGCYLIALMISGIDNSAVNLAASLIPVISVFCAPVQYMLENIELPVLIGSWLLEGAVVAALTMLAAKIYSDLLIYRGTRKKFGQIIKMGLGRKGGSRT